MIILNSPNKTPKLKTKKSWILDKIKIATVALFLGVMTNPVMSSETKDYQTNENKRNNLDFKSKFIKILEENWLNEYDSFNVKRTLVYLDEEELLDFIIWTPEIDDIIFAWKNIKLSQDTLNDIVEYFFIKYSNPMYEIFFLLKKNDKELREKYSWNQEIINILNEIRSKKDFLDYDNILSLLHNLEINVKKENREYKERDWFEIPKNNILLKYKNHDKFLNTFKNLNSKMKLFFILTLYYISDLELEMYLEINLDGANPVNKYEIDIFIKENKFYPTHFWNEQLLYPWLKKINEVLK